ADDMGLGGPLWSPVGGECGPFIDKSTSSGDPQWATIKAHPIPQPLSPLRGCVTCFAGHPERRKRSHPASTPCPPLRGCVTCIVEHQGDASVPTTHLNSPPNAGGVLVVYVH